MWRVGGVHGKGAWQGCMARLPGMLGSAVRGLYWCWVWEEGRYVGEYGNMRVCSCFAVIVFIV
ncbi:hypothetical protein AT245_07520 [Bartonella henselae]|nr:hypothetical protein AT244_00075 [Bartonella henselae]OLL45267.1 hypothetical protein AT245_07520 [Bartonella henselae]